jgi:hypothetical protein
MPFVSLEPCWEPRLATQIAAQGLGYRKSYPIQKLPVAERCEGVGMARGVPNLAVPNQTASDPLCVGCRGGARGVRRTHI